MKENVLISKEQIQERIKELGEELTRAYRGKDLVVVALLRGAYVFVADITREIAMPVCIDFMTTSSYENAEKSDGTVKILSDIREDIKGKEVLIVDDIIDTGHTLIKVKEHLESKKPNSLKICALLDKTSRRQVDLQPDYVGFPIDDIFVVGYGLDYQAYYRNTPYIFTRVN